MNLIFSDDAQNFRLFFVIGADFFKSFDINPQPVAFFAFSQISFADLQEF